MKDNLGIGVLLGAICPSIAYVLTNFTELTTTAFSQKPIAIYVIAAAINLVEVRFIYRSGREATAKGIVLITFLAMVAMVLLLKIKVCCKGTLFLLGISFSIGNGKIVEAGTYLNVQQFLLQHFQDGEKVEYGLHSIF